MATKYQIGKIRTLLQKGFTVSELCQWCYDEFRPVYDALAEQTPKNELVSELLEQAENKGQLARLLAWAREQNPAQYAEYEPYTLEPPPAPAAPSLLPPPPIAAPLPGPLRVFVGHASGHHPVITQLYDWLKEAGAIPWLDEEDVLAGQNRRQEIAQAVTAAEVVLVCLNGEAVSESGELHREISYLLDQVDQKAEGSYVVIPLRLEKCPAPDRLNELQWIDLFAPRGYDKLLRALQVHFERLQQAKAEVAERKAREETEAKAEAERKAREEVKRLAAAKAETERKAKAEAAAKAEAECQAREKAEAEQLVAAKAETERLAAEKAEVEHQAKAEAVAKVKAERQAKISKHPSPISILPRQHPFEPEMILIPAGEFLMGSDPAKDEQAQEWEQPQHTLYLPDYYLAKTPLTNAQYQVFVQATGHEPPPHWKGKGWFGSGAKEILAGKADHPVVNVRWDDALAYCRWLAVATDRPYTLPSEAEWEKGARGADGRIYPWGDAWDAGKCNDSESGPGGTTPVGAYPAGASPYGLLDMVGNVWEWTRSLWGPDLEPAFRYPYNLADGREAGTYALRVLRGGVVRQWAAQRPLRRPQQERPAQQVLQLRFSGGVPRHAVMN